MAHDAPCACHAAAQEHAKVSRGGEKHDRAHKKVHPRGNPIFRRSRAAHLLQPSHPSEGAERQWNQQQGPIVDAGLAVSAASGKPGRENQIEGENAAANIAGLVFKNCQIHRECGHDQHRRDKDFSGQDVPASAFAEDQGSGAG